MKDTEGFIYGTLSYIGGLGLKPGPDDDAPHNTSKASTGRLQQFDNYEHYIQNKGTQPTYSSRPIKSHDIESIEIIDRED